MATKTKTFDCVEMKNRLQAQLLAEYETRKGEFASFTAFLNAKADESEWAREIRSKFAQK